MPNSDETQTRSIIKLQLSSQKESFPFLSVGPLTGALAGLSQGTASTVAWNWYGQPDFLIRSGVTALVVSAMLAVGGTIFGVVYGLVLMAFGHFAKRAVRTSIHLLSASVASFTFAFGSAVYAFETHSIISPFLVAFATVMTAFLVAVFSSVPYRDPATI